MGHGDTPRLYTISPQTLQWNIGFGTLLEKCTWTLSEAIHKRSLWENMEHETLHVDHCENPVLLAESTTSMIRNSWSIAKIHEDESGPCIVFFRWILASKFQVSDFSKEKTNGVPQTRHESPSLQGVVSSQLIPMNPCKKAKPWRRFWRSQRCWI